jgi:hypothetical protein
MWYRITDFFADHRTGVAIGAAFVVVVAGIVFAFTRGISGDDAAPTTTQPAVSTTAPPATAIPARSAADVAADPDVPAECRAAAAAAAEGIADTTLRGPQRIERARELNKAFHAACAGVIT